MGMIRIQDPDSDLDFGSLRKVFDFSSSRSVFELSCTHKHNGHKQDRSHIPSTLFDVS